MKNAAYLALSSAAVFGLILSLQTTLWFIAIGALAIAAAWGYTGWKNPYGYFGFGELAVFVFFAQKRNVFSVIRKQTVEFFNGN